MGTVSPRINEDSIRFYTDHFGKKNHGAAVILDSFPRLYARTMVALRGRFSAKTLTELVEGLPSYRLNRSSVIAFLNPAAWGLGYYSEFAACTALETMCLGIWASAFYSQTAKNLATYVAELAKKE
jgi:hypothetical protein